MSMGGATVALRLITIVTGILLARILDPSDYGIVALAQVVLGTLNLFSGLGLGGAVIQSREDPRVVAFQSFCVNAATGVFLLAIVMAIADICAAVLGNPGLASVLRALAPVALLGNLAIVPEALLQKELLFGKVSAAVLGAELVNIGVSLVMAYHGFGLWSLVFGSLTRWTTYNVLIWIFSPRRDWLAAGPWNGAVMKKLLRFGFSATGGGVITFIYSSTDNIITGKWLGASALGYYSKAYDFTSRTVDSINNVIGSVLMPSYSVIQGEPERLSRAYLKSLKMIAIVTVPVAMGMFITAPEVIAVLLGAKWLPMVAPFQVLASVSVVKPLSATTSALFMSLGKPVNNLRAGIVVLVIMVPMIFALLGLNTTGVALAVLLAHIGGFLYNMYQVRQALPGTAARMIPAALPAVLSTAVMVGVVWFVKAPLGSLVGGGHNLLSVLLMVAIGATVYVFMVFLLQGAIVREVLGLVLKRSKPLESPKA
jgi:O-antigen/teichoic acid export membrane protein